MTDTHDQPEPADNVGSDPSNAQPDKPGSKAVAWAKFLLRWGIAIVGIVWVISGLTLRDRVYLLQETDGQPRVLDVALDAPFEAGTDQTFTYLDPETNEPKTADASLLLNGPDRKTVQIGVDGERVEMPLAAMRLVEQPGAPDNAMPVATDLWVYTDEPIAKRIEPGDVLGGFNLQVPQPIVRTGLSRLVAHAKPVLLALAVLVFPVTLAATGLRWWLLMRPLGIVMKLRRAYVLNMVGVFYNSFMLGSTGGDFIKAYYAGKHAAPGRKAAAWLSVFVDRAMGLLVLVLMAGTAAAVQFLLEHDRTSPVATACLNVIWASIAILLATSVGLLVALNQPIRKGVGLSFVLGKAAREGGKIRETLQSVFDTIHTYYKSPRTIVVACLLTVPVHGTVIISAMLAGQAFGLPIPWPYYFVCVPVIVLSASMPISPQGAGVMEFFAVLLTRPQGATVSQAFALALSIRVVQIIWNLTGGIFVFRGGYSEPANLDAADDDEAESADDTVTVEAPLGAVTP